MTVRSQSEYITHDNRHYSLKLQLGRLFHGRRRTTRHQNCDTVLVIYRHSIVVGNGIKCCCASDDLQIWKSALQRSKIRLWAFLGRKNKELVALQGLVDVFKNEHFLHLDRVRLLRICITAALIKAFK